MKIVKLCKRCEWYEDHFKGGHSCLLGRSNGDRDRSLHPAKFRQGEWKKKVYIDAAEFMPPEGCPFELEIMVHKHG